jgi:hypothetical protein
MWVKNSSVFIWSHANEICEMEPEGASSLLPQLVKNRRGGMISPV